MSITKLHEYTFDVKLFATATLHAPDEKTARKLVANLDLGDGLVCFVGPSSALATEVTLNSVRIGNSVGREIDIELITVDDEEPTRS